MKALAIIDVAPGTSIDAMRTELAHELKVSWALFTSGILREAYATASPTRVVFVLEATDLAGAADHLRTLPLIAAGQFRVELIELRPFANWSLLFGS